MLGTHHDHDSRRLFHLEMMLYSGLDKNEVEASNSTDAVRLGTVHTTHITAIVTCSFRGHEGTLSVALCLSALSSHCTGVHGDREAQAAGLR